MNEDINPDQSSADAFEIDHPDTEPYFFTTAPLKLALMSICTFGGYPVYWFYRNWVCIKKHTGADIMPLWRAIFAPIWAYSCFKQINQTAREKDIPEEPGIMACAIFYLLFKAAHRLPAPYLLVRFFSFATILPANKVALAVNQKMVPGFTDNREITSFNMVAVLFGGILVLFATYSAFLPVTP